MKKKVGILISVLGVVVILSGSVALGSMYGKSQRYSSAEIAKN